MKTKLIVGLTVFFVSFGFVLAENVEIQLSYGRWSLSPLTTIVERESENMIRETYRRFVEDFFPGLALSSFITAIDLSSSGQYFCFGFWYNLKNTQFSLGLRGNYVDFQLPYSIDADQSISFLQYELVRLKTSGEGEVNINSLTISVLGRWKALSQGRIGLFLYGGLIFFPYQGDLSINQNTMIQTPLGDLVYQGALDQTISQIRTWNEDVPLTIISPEVGMQFQVKLLKNLGLVLDVALSQGSLFSAGLFFIL